MNRFEYLYPDITPHETVTRNDRAIKLYDGDVKVTKNNNILKLNCTKNVCRFFSVCLG